MQHSVAAIRAGRLRARFTSPLSDRREPRLGLRRSSTVPVTPHVGGRDRRRPLRAVREAARGLSPVTTRPAAHLSLRRADDVTWTSAVPRGRRLPRLGSAAPWRA